MGKNAPSIVYLEDFCAAHKKTDTPCEGRLEKHHIFYGNANRRLADRDGLTCYLCGKHHRWAPYGIHGGNTELDHRLKKDAQKAYMKEHHATVEDFIKRYGKNYL